MINRRLPNIIVPKNRDSLMLLYENKSEEGDYIVFPLGREDLKELFNVGIFNQINEKVGILIDAYEEEDISDINSIEIAKSVIAEFKNKKDDPIIGYYLNCFNYLFNKAIELHTGIFFYF